MYDEEIEKAMLTYVIHGNEIYELDEKDFVKHIHKKIIKAVNNLRRKGIEVDILTVRNEIDSSSLELLKYITDIGFYIAGMSGDTSYKLIKEYTKKREILELSKKIQLETSNQEEIDVYIEKCIKELQTIENQTEKEQEFSNQIIETTKRIETRINTKENRDLFTGFFDLDDLTDGLHNGEMTVVGARPGTGKTTFALQIAENIASKNKNVLFISMEMSAEQIIEKIIARKAHIDSNKIRRGNLEERELVKISETCIQIADLKMEIGTNINTIQQIEIKARKMKSKEKLDLLVIDYLQLVKSQGKFGNREQEVADISRTLKSIALELNIPIIALCQLNRNANRNEPTLADIRESGAIEQDADNVIFLYQQKNDNVVTVDLQKQREGCTGIVKLKFNKATSEFINLIR